MTDREVIKGISHSLRISHAEIGEKIGISQASVTRMLNGDTAMRSDRLAKMCEAIGAELIIRRGGKEYKLW